jgi:hypothetical protein
MIYGKTLVGVESWLLRTGVRAFAAGPYGWPLDADGIGPRIRL